MQRGQQSLAQIHQNVETNLSLATHAETWKWKEIETSLQTGGNHNDRPN
jgi:hypothetical protein